MVGSQHYHKWFIISMHSFARVVRVVRTYSTVKRQSVERLIKKHTTISRDHLTPEISMHLITLSSALWSAKPEDIPFNDPFWAFYWPGGQSVARYILDNPSAVLGKHVLDVGSGSGACAIAAAMKGALSVTANDIDVVSGVAIALNSKLNNVHVEVCTDDLVGRSCEKWDCVLCGDVFYDAEFAERLLTWLKILSLQGKRVLIGDPGRQALKQIQCGHWKCLGEYSLTEMSCLENSGFNTSCVWQM